jgi:hypothetical protein
VANDPVFKTLRNHPGACLLSLDSWGVKVGHFLNVNSGRSSGKSGSASLSSGPQFDRSQNPFDSVEVGKRTVCLVSSDEFQHPLPYSGQDILMLLVQYGLGDLLAHIVNIMSLRQGNRTAAIVLNSLNVVPLFLDKVERLSWPL